MSATETLTQKWLRQNTQPYSQKDYVFTDIDLVLSHFQTLRPKSDVYTYDDGRTQLLLCVHGLLPISFRSASYNIPIAIWVTRDYPRQPPITYVVPTNDMLVKAGKYVDVSGRCHPEYLQHWERKFEGCSLFGLVEALQQQFSREPPVYAKPSNPASSSTSGGLGHAGRPPPPTPSVNAQPMASQSMPVTPAHPHPHRPALPPKPGPSSVHSNPSSSDSFQSIHHRPFSSEAAYPVARTEAPTSPQHTYELGPPQYRGLHGTPPVPPIYQPIRGTPAAHSVSDPGRYEGQVAASEPHWTVQPPPPPPPPPHPSFSIPILSSPPPPPPLSPPQPQPQFSVQQPQPQLQVGHPTVVNQAPIVAPNLLDEDTDLYSTYQVPSSVPAPPRPPNPELLHLHEQVHQRLTSELASLSQALSLDAERLRAHQADLLAGEPAIRDEMARLEAVRDVCRNVAGRMRGTVDQAERNVSELRRKGDPEVDELVCSTSIVHNQLVNLVAEDNAIEDTVYHLHRALNASRIDLERFLRTTRVLAEEQFMKRSLIEKIQTGLPIGMIESGWS